MLRNYLLTGFRSLIRHRFFSAINIFGLAVAMSICMGIIMLVADQMSYDRYNTNRDRIFRVNTYSINENGEPTDSKINSASPMPLRQELLDNYTGVEKVVRIRRGFGNGWVEFENDLNIPLAGFYADPEVFDFFQYEFQYGDPATALLKPYTVVVTRKAANKLFKDDNPVGQTIEVGDLGTFTVTGVLKETNHKSHIVFEAFASISTLVSKQDEVMDEWPNYWNGWTYVLLEPGMSLEKFHGQLEKIYEDRIASIKDPGQYKMKFTTQSMMNITPGNITNNSIGPVLPWVFIYFLGGLALLILLTSCFNFTNLSIARSLTRAREIGIRKATGAVRWQIFTQFLSESIIVALLALVIGVGLLLIIKPLVLQLNLARLFRWDLQANVFVYAVFIVFAFVVGTLAGFFPAVVLSAFQPVKVLKGITNMKLFSRMGLRKVLLVSQFTLSLFFILSVIIVYNQLSLFMHQDHGFNMDNNIVIKLHKTSAQNLKNELVKYGNITSVTAASHVPAAGTSYGNGFKKQLDDPDWFNAGFFLVDEDYASNMGLTLTAGKFFEPENNNSNKNLMVINQTAVKNFNYESDLDAIGKELIFQRDSSRKTIIGVVKDYNHRDLTREINSMVLLYNPEEFQVLQVAYAGTYENASHSIEAAWEKVNPDLKIDYQEVESEVKQFYELVFGDITKVLGVVASLAIMISCLGLLGMATYTTETRIKEISIRKILGSSGAALVMLLSKGFLNMLLMAIIIGVPATYFINNLWLELIAYHTTLSVNMVIIGISILLLFGGLTIGSQTIRATFVKPVDNLKSE